jgi:hypothetical protein
LLGGLAGGVSAVWFVSRQGRHRQLVRRKLPQRRNGGTQQVTARESPDLLHPGTFALIAEMMAVRWLATQRGESLWRGRAIPAVRYVQRLLCTRPVSGAELAARVH